MEGWFEAEWVRAFLAVFAPALLGFMLIQAYRPLYWAVWGFLFLGLVLFLGSYQISGYIEVLSGLAGNVLALGSARAAGFLAGVLLARPAVRGVRRLRAWRRSRREQAVPAAIQDAAPQTEQAEAVRAAVVATLLLLPLLAAPALAKDDLPGPSGAWRPLLYMNQIVLNRDLEPVCYCGLPVEAEEVPETLKKALVAIEDRRFRIHRGIDPIGMLRAVKAFILGRRLQGGSTLSQQLAKFSLLTDERTLLRKGQDVLWGLKIDAALSKDEIILLYLNRATFGWAQGRPIVGVEQASRHFFNKHARDLNLFEAAALAGLVNAPLRLNPKRNPRRFEVRARLVLQKMREQGYVSRAEVATALSRGVRRGGLKPVSIEARYFADRALAEFAALVPPIEPRPGLRLLVSLDSRSQLNAESALKKALARLAARRAGEGALVAIDHRGQIRAMVGGRDYSASQFNRAVKAKRQPASVFKPFVYLTALEQGMRPGTRILDVAPERVAATVDVVPHYHGLLTFQEALALSANGAAVRLADKVGLANVAQTAKRLGIVSPLRADRSLALGTSEVTLIELTSAFAPFANGGFRARSRALIAVVDRGRIHFLAEEGAQRRVIRKGPVAGMRQMLRAVVATGTGRAANIRADAAGKTGTSQDNRDALFVGYAGAVVTGVWLGNDDHSPMPGVTGSDAAATWANFMANELAR